MLLENDSKHAHILYGPVFLMLNSACFSKFPEANEANEESLYKRKYINVCFTSLI